MKIYINIVLLLCFSVPCLAQITFNGCHQLFEDQDYVFNLVDTDETGRNVYTTTPVDGEQACGGIGTCEFRIAWNDANSTWEFIADDGDGDFSAPLLIYSNIAVSSPNPPGILLGTWVENNAITTGDCGGDLSTSNASFSGDVQNTALSTTEFDLKKLVSVYPNPANRVINIQSDLNLERLSFLDLNGKLILSQENNLETIDVSKLNRGLYFLKIGYKKNISIRKIMIN